MLMVKDLGTTFFGIGEAIISSSLVAKHLRQRRWGMQNLELSNHKEHEDHRDGMRNSPHQLPPGRRPVVGCFACLDLTASRLTGTGG